MNFDIFSIFWIFFMISALQPVIKQRLLEASRQKLIARIEKQRNSRVILLVHRQETMSLLGFPIFRFINVNDSEEVIRGKVTVFVPHYAMSGGTLIALSGDEIVMGEHAVLGPVDPQLSEYPAASLVKLAGIKPIADIDDRTWLLADVGKKAMDQLKKQVRSLLDGRYPADKAEELATILSEGRWTHDYPITYEEATALGLHVSNNIPPEFYQLMGLYPQPVRQQPSVEYLPVPRFRGPTNQKTGRV